MAKKDLHPKYYPDAKVTCACGNTFTTGSTKPELRVEVCYKCHPAYTGEERTIDTGGQVEKFERKRKAAKVQLEKEQKKKKAKKVEEKEEAQPKTLKELLEST